MPRELARVSHKIKRRRLYRPCTDIRSTAHTLAFIVGRFGGFASGYVVENANSIPFATTVLIIMAALSALGTLTLRETMGERLS